MKKMMKKISLLGLSFMLVTPFAVSSALPAMLTYYQKQGYTVSQVEQLFSLSSLMILVILLLNPILRHIPERIAIILGLLLISFGGTLPAFNQDYGVLFISRLVLGTGVGLINAHAINIISHHYQGDEKTKVLGLRGSSEVLGSASLTLLAGQFLTLGWSKAYLIYLFGLLMLAMYLLFVPKIEEVVEEPAQEVKEKLTGKQLVYLVSLAAYAGFIILVNTANMLRIPLVVEQLDMGTATQSSFILTLMMLMGILSGLVFSQIIHVVNKWFSSLVPLIFGLGMILLWQAHSLWLLGVGAVLTGFVYSLGVTFVFHKVSESFSINQLGTATTIVLLGCSLGGGGAAFALQAASTINTDITFAFLLFGVLNILLGSGLLVAMLRKGTI
ncbi:MFS transporter [Streptococcus sp. S784/96/1]|uniref:MFS transporter n=1 Tax=Streptococcus sp. S784/96/1 TaxID=2653499 RepID=UPI001386CF02|nr:MFS transporter [Streptococcus sp. S784/96/1]